jgi:geranylgeranyl pyrophosphate synthase
MSAAPLLETAGPPPEIAPPALRRLFEAALAREAVAVAAPLPFLAEAAAQTLGTAGHSAGRRWRPMLALVTAEACGGEATDALSVALAVELTHTASLLLDDLPCMDDAATRRGELVAHRRLGNAGAILLAVGLLGRASERLGEVRHAGGTLAASWGRTIGLAGMAGGQAIDLAATGRTAPRGAARRLMRRKTTALAALACEGGARAVRAAAPTVDAVTRFGRDLGWAYQLADDACDAAEDAAAGRCVAGRAPARQAAYLLARAGRRLTGAPLPRDGAQRLRHLADRVVGSMLDAAR